MNDPQGLEALMNAAQGDDWSVFDNLDDHVKSAVDPRLAKEEDELKRQRLASAAATIFSTPEGELVLDAICDKTLRRNSYFAMLGIDPLQVAMFGAFREGQNALVNELLRLRAQGLNEPQPPQRGMDNAT